MSLVQMVVKYLVPRKVAVDASMSLYQFLIAVRQVRTGLGGSAQIVDQHNGHGYWVLTVALKPTRI